MGAAVGQTAARVLCLPIVGWVLGCDTGTNPSKTALDDIPADYLTLYMQAATVCPGLNWSTLAAIGKIESDHGRSQLPGVHSGTNSAGAAGEMQFELPTFAEVIARHTLPSGGANPPSPYNPHDAIYAAAYYLCDNHAATDLHDAIYHYNHAEWYVSEVLAQAAQYASSSNNVGLAAVTYAQGQLGIPYLWGGDGLQEGGWDCSGLTRAAYQAAGIELPRTAQEQYDAGPHLAPGQPLEIGDLLFYGAPAAVHHVSLYNGDGQAITASGQGQVVKIAPYRWNGDDYLGATRPVK